MSSFENKKLLLEQFYELSKQIKISLEKEQIKEANILIERKNSFITKLKAMKDIENNNLSELISNIKKRELENIELAKVVKEKLYEKYKTVSKKAKINLMYSSDKYTQGKIVDYIQ